MNARSQTTAQVMAQLGMGAEPEGLGRRALTPTATSGVALVDQVSMPNVASNLVTRAVDSFRLGSALSTVRKEAIDSYVEQVRLRLRTNSDLAMDAIADTYQTAKADVICRRSASAHSLEQNVEAQRAVAEDYWIDARNQRIGDLVAMREAGKLSDEDFKRRVRKEVARFDRLEQRNDQRADHNLDNVSRLLQVPGSPQGKE